MIISASRRTDLPALYTSWLLNRARAGWCVVPNPFNPKQIARISLRPEDVDAFIFWTRWPAPLLARMDELENIGLSRSLFLVTLLDYPRIFEPRLPPLRMRLAAFAELSARLGPDRVVWRYDPIICSNATPAQWHITAFRRLAEALRGKTTRCIISVLDFYKKMQPRLNILCRQGLTIPKDQEGLVATILPQLADIATTNGIILQTCAQKQNWSSLGATPGACVDAAMLNTLFGVHLPETPDPHQRKHCRCAPSRDIGMYDTCTFGCAYCYATTDFSGSLKNRSSHDPSSPSLLGHLKPPAQQLSLPGLHPTTQR